MISQAIGSKNPVQIEAVRKQIEAEALAKQDASQAVVDVAGVSVENALSASHPN